MTLLPYQVWRHAIGTPASQDKLIYEEKDDTYYVSLHKNDLEALCGHSSGQRHHQ